jgi:hypothetical protein
VYHAPTRLLILGAPIGATPRARGEGGGVFNGTTDLSGCLADLAAEPVTLTELPLQQVAHHRETGPGSSSPVFPFQVATDHTPRLGLRLGGLADMRRHELL